MQYFWECVFISIVHIFLEPECVCGFIQVTERQWCAARHVDVVEVICFLNFLLLRQSVRQCVHVADILYVIFLT